jgi:hypothetical protein
MVYKVGLDFGPKFSNKLHEKKLVNHQYNSIYVPDVRFSIIMY